MKKGIGIVVGILLIVLAGCGFVWYMMSPAEWEETAATAFELNAMQSGLLNVTNNNHTISFNDACDPDYEYMLTGDLNCEQGGVKCEYVLNNITVKEESLTSANGKMPEYTWTGQGGTVEIRISATDDVEGTAYIHLYERLTRYQKVMRRINSIMESMNQ